MATCTYPLHNAELRPESKSLQDNVPPKGRCGRCGRAVPGEKVSLCRQCESDRTIICGAMKKFPPFKH